MLRYVDSTARAIDHENPAQNPRGMSDSGRIAKENHAARGFAIDPKVLELAEEAARNLQGGRAAVLTPERRRRIMSMATRLGVRAFDASLVIAITQDRARLGSINENTGNPAPDARLGLVGNAPRGNRTGSGNKGPGVLWLIAGGLVTGLGVFGALVAWVVR